VSMNSDQEKYQDLRRLLALKRHEVPPPGYFEGFSRQVIVRIRAGDQGREESFILRFFGQGEWLHRFWAPVESQPRLAGAFTLGLCSLLACGVIYSGNSDSAIPGVATWAAAEPSGAGLIQPIGLAAPAAVGQFVNSDLSSMGGLAAPQSQPSLFDQARQLQRPLVEPASKTFSPAFGN
jgi:hypothetical protein